MPASSRHSGAIRLAPMANLGPLIASLTSTRDAVVRLGPVLIVKANGLLSVNQLTSAQQELLNQRPDLTAAPGEILTTLRLSRHAESPWL